MFPLLSGVKLINKEETRGQSWICNLAMSRMLKTQEIALESDFLKPSTEINS